MSKEIKIEYEPMMIETCLQSMFILESTINDDVQAKLNDITRLSNQISNNTNSSIAHSHSQLQSPHQSPHNNQMNQPQYGHNQRATRGASFEDRFGGHSPNANNPNFNANGYHFASQSMYQLKTHRSADIFEENHNNYSNPNQNPNNLSSPLHNNARSASFSQLQSLSPNPPPANNHLFGGPRPTKRASFGSYGHFNDPHNNYGNPQQQQQQQQQSQPPPAQPPMRNRPHSFAYNDQSYVPLFNAGAKSNPLLSNHNQPGHARNGSSPALGSVQPKNKNRIDNSNGSLMSPLSNNMSPLSVPNNDQYYPQSQQQSQARPRQHSGGGIPRYSPPFGPQQANNNHHSPPFGSKANRPLPYSPPANMTLNGNKNINNSTFAQLPPSNSPPLSFQQLPITGFNASNNNNDGHSHNNNKNTMNGHAHLNGNFSINANDNNRSYSVYHNPNVNNVNNDKNNRSHSVFHNGSYSHNNNNGNHNSNHRQNNNGNHSHNNNNNGNNQIHPILIPPFHVLMLGYLVHFHGHFLIEIKLVDDYFYVSIPVDDH